MNVAQITVYGGAGMVGGNQILVEDQRGAFFFDFGIPFADRPTAGGALTDALAAGSAPPIEGIYRQDLLPDAAGLARMRAHPHHRRLDAVDGVLISHAHPDHAGYLPFLNAGVPVFASVMTAAILKATQDTSAPTLANQTAYLNAGDERLQPRPFTFLLTQNDSTTPQGSAVETFPEVYEFWGSMPAVGGARQMPANRPPLLPQFSQGLNGRALHHYPLDHSILGTTGYAVETPDGWIAYTGDMRFHGSQPGLMEEFVDGLARLRPLALIAEGTHTRPGATPVTEQDVHNRLMELVSGEPGLVVADFGPRNMERLLTFNGVAEFCQRALILTTRDAYLLNAMGKVWRQFPALDSVSTFRIYDTSAAGDAPAWEQELRQRFGGIFVTPEQIRADPRSYILCLSPEDLSNPGDVFPGGGLYVRSTSEDWDEDHGFDVAAFRQRLDRANVRAFGLPEPGEAGTPWHTRAGEDNLHASGHATFDRMIAMIRRVNPTRLIPVHTRNAQRFADALRGDPVQVSLPRRGEPLTVR